METFISDKNTTALAILIDPDKTGEKQLNQLIRQANQGYIQYFFVGGSILTTGDMDATIHFLKQNTEVPVLLFPGSTMQLSDEADGILFLSLLSGRNADLLIGKHVEAAPFLHKSQLEVISTGYLLIDSGKPTSVSYMSGTNPIPHDKDEIAVCTAIAGEMLGVKSIYLEAGSGAEKSVSSTMITAVKSKIQIPLIVGGGIRTAAKAKKIAMAGADIIVMGTRVEEDAQIIPAVFEAINPSFA